MPLAEGSIAVVNIGSELIVRMEPKLHPGRHYQVKATIREFDRIQGYGVLPALRGPLI